MGTASAGMNNTKGKYLTVRGIRQDEIDQAKHTSLSSTRANRSAYRKARSLLRRKGVIVLKPKRTVYQICTADKYPPPYMATLNKK